MTCRQAGELGQMFIVMDPSRFVGLDAFKASMSQVLDELGEMPAAEGFDKVYYPGERAVMRRIKPMPQAAWR